MSTLEMICWGGIAACGFGSVALVLMLALSNRAVCSESDYLVAAADAQGDR